MYDYEELIKSLRQCAEGSCAGCKNDLVQIGCRGLLQHEAADAIEELQKLTDAQLDIIKQYQAYLDKTRWIKFVLRPLTEEEQREHPDWCYILDCRTPDDNQEILVSDGRYVWTDTFYQDGDQCYLDGGAELENCWWQPMPQPPKEGT